MVFSQLSFIGPDSYLAVEPKGFGLSTDFDQILLLDSFNQTIDEVVYGPQNSVSEGIIKGENSYENFYCQRQELITPLLELMIMSYIRRV